MAHDDADRRFDDLARRYARLIQSVVRKIAGPETDNLAEDIGQKVLVALWKAGAGEQEIRHPSSYIYRAAVRETVRVLREEHRRRERTRELAEEKGNRVWNPEELARSKELGVRILESLSDLSGDRRRAVQAHLGGFSAREIMEMFDWPYNKARNLIARGVADLRKGLRARGIDG
ncbi:MAG: RNA polymerase sigma factor [Thermoanaerobaculales bacterium]